MAKLTLLTTKGTVHNAAGVNWGGNSSNHTTPFDAYIPLHIATIRRNAGLIPPKRAGGHRIQITWDDGTVMSCLLEGNLPDSRTNLVYPKQISSTPNKNTLGLYLRNRMGLAAVHFITLADLNNYGRTDVDLVLVGPDQYTADFHV
ncbi:hypothetical protein [Sphingobacterium sp. LRF_L2]|uniref:hypothetical protein n=1 Tax=Sphingobacterium sp. LRF_L2 TaxID=3369421 RepID=UPI003F63F786